MQTKKQEEFEGNLEDEIIEDAPYPPSTPSNYKFLGIILVVMSVILLIVAFSIFQNVNSIPSPVLFLSGIVFLVALVFIFLGIKRS